MVVIRYGCSEYPRQMVAIVPKRWMRFPKPASMMFT